MIMREGGLVLQWMKMFRPNANFCLSKAKEMTSFSPETSFAALTLKNLNGAFVVLATGCFAAFIVFICEIMVFRYVIENKKKSRST